MKKESKDRRVNALISVIIPVFNVAPYIDRCLESVTGQTYRQIEIILVDDGSWDGSGLLCDQWVKRDSRIRVVHQKNSGVSRSRNEGLRLATGEYIAFCDGDDFLELSMYEEMIQVLNNENADICCCGYVRKYGDCREVNCPVRGGMVDREEACALLIDDIGFFTAVWNKMYRRECCRDIEFNENIHMNEDGEWNARILKQVSSVVCMGEALYIWNRRGDSATHFGEKGLQNDRKSLTVVHSWENIYHEFKSISPILEQKSYKRFLAVLKERIIATYVANDKIYDELILRSESVRKYSTHLGIRDSLFLIKYSILLCLIKMHVKPAVVKRIDML